MNGTCALQQQPHCSRSLTGKRCTCVAPDSSPAVVWASWPTHVPCRPGHRRFIQSGTSASFIDQRPGRRDGELWRPVHPFKRIAPLAWRSMFFLGILAAACVCCNAQDSAGKSKFRIVFDNLSDSGVDIFSMDQLGGEVKRLTSDHMSHSPAWSPDGQQIAYLEDVPAGPREDSLNLKNFSFTLDRAQLSVAPHHNLLLMPMNGAEPRKIASLGPDVTGIAWLPNAQWIALRSSNRRNLKVCVTQGKKIDGKCEGLSTVKDEADAFHRANGKWNVTQILEYYPPIDNFAPTVYLNSAGDSRELSQAELETVRSTIPYFPDLAASLALNSLDGANAEPPVPASDAAWSAEGKRIAWSVFSESHNSILYVADLKDNHPQAARALTEPALEAHSPTWSADGSRLAFSGLGKGSQQIFAINADGTGLIPVSRILARSCSHPSWSPDGRWIVAECHANRRITWVSWVSPVHNPGWFSSIYLFDMNKLAAAPRVLVDCGDDPMPDSMWETRGGSANVQVAGRAMLEPSGRDERGNPLRGGDPFSDNGTARGYVHMERECGAHNPSFAPLEAAH